MRAGGAAVHAAAHPREAMDRSRRVAELIVRDELRGAPHTSVNVPIGQTRRYAVVQAPLEELKEIGHHLGGSITDVVLAAATAACGSCCSRARRSCRHAAYARWCRSPDAMHRTD